MKSDAVACVPRPGWILQGSLCLVLSFCWTLHGCADTTSTPTGAVQKNGKGEGARRGAEEGAPVTVATAAIKDVPVDVQVVGSVEAYLTVTIKAQVSGELTGVHFREGDSVKKGDLLFRIDPRQLQAQLSQAQANLARDEAQLSQAEANLARDTAQEKYAKAGADRYSRLLDQRLVSKEQAEQMRTSAEVSGAAVRADEASIRSARAAVAATRAAIENISVQLGYTSIYSPVDGRTGDILVQQGNIVSANSTGLTTINQIQPVYVTFSVPEARLAEVKLRQPVTASSHNKSGPPETGELSFIDNTVDTATGMIKLRGIFPNSNRRLWPGEFVRVTLRLGTQPSALVIPSHAVQTGQDGTYVFVVKADGTVESRPVVTGARAGQEFVVEKGLKAGEVVVTEGHMRLAPGSRVQVRNAPGNAPGSESPAMPEP
jgi:multidrug efflux system membrane fusion protein